MIKKEKDLIEKIFDKLDEISERISKLENKPAQINPFNPLDPTHYQKHFKWDLTQHSDCMHLNCSSCNGTGVRNDGLGTCIHMMSCPCKRCSPFCM